MTIKSLTIESAKVTTESLNTTANCENEFVFYMCTHRCVAFVDNEDLVKVHRGRTNFWLNFLRITFLKAKEALLVTFSIANGNAHCLNFTPYEDKQRRRLSQVRCSKIHFCPCTSLKLAINILLLSFPFVKTKMHILER